MGSWDHHLFYLKNCPETTIEQWSSWEKIEGKLGFALLFSDLWTMPNLESYVSETLPKAWDAICALALVEVGEQKENEVLSRRK